jgi:hypothetical protein
MDEVGFHTGLRVNKYVAKVMTCLAYFTEGKSVSRFIYVSLFRRYPDGSGTGLEIRNAGKLVEDRHLYLL